jgi:hypothetical protein
MPRDEAYVIDLCDRVLGQLASRQHRFAFLLGDTGRMLPVDAYYENLDLVVEYRERQHYEPVKMWDQKPTCSGVPRGQQRALYDQRRRDLLPQHGIYVVEFSFSEFRHDGAKRLLRVPEDEAVIRLKLAPWRVVGD